MNAQDLSSGGPAPGECIVPTSAMCTPTTPLADVRVRQAVRDGESSAPDAIQAVAREVAEAARTILGADSSAVVSLDPVGDVLEAVAATGPRDPARTVSSALRDLVTRTGREGKPVWERGNPFDANDAPGASAPSGHPAALASTLAIPLTGGAVLVLPGIRDAGGAAASAPGVVTAVGALASAALEQSRRATRLAEEFDALQKGHHQTIETERLHAVGELAAGAAHHLNNVMTVILGSVDLALRRPHSIEIGHLEVIRRAALEVTEIVRRLGSFSRRNSQGPHLIVDLNALAEEALALTRGRWHDEAQLNGIDIDVQLCAGLTPPVGADEVSLREVLVNLLFNAIDALPEGGNIRVRTWSTEDVVHCEVSDDGIGMSPEVRQRAAEPFFTTKGLRRRGLGLSLSYGIIRQHGGTLTIKSAQGHGTTVTFTLPTSGSLRVRETEGAARVGTGQMVILLVDDDPGVRATVASLLADDGHTVVEAGSGAEALSRLDTTESFDLLMTDLGMPKMNGWELIRSAKLKRPELPVVLITGWGETPRGQRPSDPQPAAILAKPVTEDDLRQTIVRFHRRVAPA
jgi:signal transduction histidine kinase/ActR/RegA family two-component response regulator